MNTSATPRRPTARTLRAASRVLIGTLLAAYALISLHVFAAVPSGAAPQAEAVESPCHGDPGPPPTQQLLCKHHCLSELQTLDHPQVPPVVQAHAAPPSIIVGLVFPHSAMLPAPPHHSGAPPPGPPVFASTARLRI